MDIGRAFSYMFDDEDWAQKVLLGALLSIIPIIGPFYALGFATEVIRNIIQGRAPLLPDITEDFGGKLLKGLLVWIIQIIYILPTIIVGAITGGIGGLATAAMEGSGDAASSVPIAISICGGFISFLVGVACGLFIPYAWSSYAETGEFGAAFNLSKIFAMIKANIGPTLLVLLIAGLAGAIVAPLGLIVCIIGAIFTQFYVQLLTAFLYGSLYQDAQAKTL
jgi:hypothetical protein